MLRFVPMEVAAIGASFDLWIETAVSAIELLAVAIILISIVFATVRFLFSWLTRRRRFADFFRQYKHTLASGLLLALELLVAADVVYTVVLDFTLANVGALGLLVLVRTFLSWSLIVEIEGRWPWQHPAGAEKSVEGIE